MTFGEINPGQLFTIGKRLLVKIDKECEYAPIRNSNGAGYAVNVGDGIVSYVGNATLVEVNNLIRMK